MNKCSSGAGDGLLQKRLATLQSAKPARPHLSLALPVPQLGPGELQHGLAPVHLRAAGHLVPLLPASVPEPAASIAARRPAATSATDM